MFTIVVSTLMVNAARHNTASARPRWPRAVLTGSCAVLGMRQP